MHRVDGPAFCSVTGQSWWVNGKRHRVGAPAVIGPDEEEWYSDGKLHRSEGPAVVTPNRQAWYLNGELHRIDGPAEVYPDQEIRFLHGEKHRTDGPALIKRSGGILSVSEEWLHGRRVSLVVEEFIKDIGKPFEVWTDTEWSLFILRFSIEEYDPASYTYE